MAIQDEISKIQSERYGNYKGTQFHHLKELHQEIRDSAGDERFLKFLQQLQEDNPRPVYSIPNEFYNKD